MIAIETRYIGPSNTRGSRYVAETCNGHRTYSGANDSLDSEENHRAVAKKLAEKYGWLDRNNLVGGGSKRGMVWVFVPKAED